MADDGGAPIDNAGQFALAKHAQESGTGWLLGGLLDITAAVKAVAAANEAHALSIDPHAVDTMLKKLTAMQDELDRVAGGSASITSDTPLGGGYARHVGQVNREIGNQVLAETIPKLTRAIDDLKVEIDRSRASYQNVDAAYTDTLNNT